jgi:hypothetical protein
MLWGQHRKIEIFLNTLNEDLFSNPFTQTGVVTSPFMHISDLNNDGLNDLLFYQKKRDGKISILLNKGEWKEKFPSDKKFESRSVK